MIRIIVTVVLVVLVAVLVALNLPFSTEVNLFGARFPGVPVVAVAALSFVLGIIYSLFIYFTRYLRRRAKNTIARKNKTLSEREKSLAEKEAGADARPGQAGADPLRQPGSGGAPQSLSWRARFFGRKPKGS